MALLGRFLILLPALLSVVGVILAALCLFAGHEKGFMEEYAIVRLNTSQIGQNMLHHNDDEASEQEEDDGDGGLFDSIGDAWDDITDTVTDSINDILNDVAGDVANALGIQDWYSLHVMEACEGGYKPNATVEGASLNITNCTNSDPGFRLNLNEILSHELSVGPIDISLEDLGWDDEIQDKLDILNDALLALFIFYVLGMGFSGLSFIAALVGFLLPDRRRISLVNFSLTSLAATSLLVGSIIVTVIVTKGVKEINDVAEDFGIKVDKGDKFMGITWGAAAVMIVAQVFWVAHFVMARKARKHHVRAKEMSEARHSTE